MGMSQLALIMYWDAEVWVVSRCFEMSQVIYLTIFQPMLAIPIGITKTSTSLPYHQLLPCTAREVCGTHASEFSIS